jgi:3-hydroxyacyl-[acyl-carrier-protein] dehydratase
MNKDAIMSILPHRGNMLLIDEVILEDGKAHGKYTVRGDEWFLDGHFPGNPVVPGVILCEILAQSTCVLLEGDIEAGATPYFTGITSARFKAPVKPGDIIETECFIQKSKPPFYFASGELRVEGKLCLKAEFSFAIIPLR